MMQPNQKSICRLIQRHAEVDAVYLYGSRAKQTAHADSDWDIAVIFSHFETDPLQRALRPQTLEAALEKALALYGKISVVDLETAPVYLQVSILMSAVKWYDRLVPHVRRVEQSILSKWEKDYERYSYEQALLKHQQKMLRILDEFSEENPNQWTERDRLAIQRALQVYIESFIGMARYWAQQRYDLSLAQSREAVDELRNRGELTADQHEGIMKIIGFRNVLVHDYLDLNEAVVIAILQKKLYRNLHGQMQIWQQALKALD